MNRLIVLLLLPLLCAASPAPTLAGNLLEINRAWGGDIGKLARKDARLVTKTSSHRVDAESCQSVTGREMNRALYSCLPLLEIFRAFEPMRLTLMTREYLRDPNSLVSKTFAKKSDQFFVLAGDRQYPAADIAIVHTHLIQSLVFESRDSPESAIAELDAALKIIATTKIADPQFDISFLLLERKKMLEKSP